MTSISIVDPKINWISTSKHTYKHLEKCGRACYQTHDREEHGSEIKFVSTINSRKHWSVLEHGVFIFRISPTFYCHLKDIEDRRFINITCVPRANRFMASGSYRAWKEIAERTEDPAALKACQVISRYAPELFGKFAGMECKFTTSDCDDIPDLHPFGITLREYLVHKHYTVSIDTNRGVTHEFVRHRPCAFSQESTRYVGYGDGKMKVIRPVFWDKWDDEVKDVWHDSMSEVTNDYGRLVGELGLPYQEAREILPNALKAELVITANLAEWIHILLLRSGKAAHPEFRKCAKALIENFKQCEPRVFTKYLLNMGNDYENTFYAEKIEWADILA